MKLSRASSPGLRSVLALALLGFLPAVHGAPATPSPASEGTNSTPAKLVISQSIFDLATKPVKDPFFPLSTRTPFPVVVVTNNAAPAISAASFTLRGLSGQQNERLALINNRTIAVGEDAEVATPSGKIKIRCLEIKESSVVIRAENQPETIEVHLRKGL